MKNNSLAFLTLAVCALSSLGSAQFLDARNRAMGGTGVASSHYASAGFLNPALLSSAGKNDTFALILPSISVGLADENGLVDAIDAFQDQVTATGNTLDSAAPPAQKLAAVVALNNSLNNLNNKTGSLDVGLGFSFAMPSEDGLSWAIVLSGSGDGQITARVDPSDVARIATSTSSTDLDGLQSEGAVLGALVTELGVAFAKEFSLAGLSLSVGATPKLQRIETYNYSININTFDNDDYDDARYRDDVSKFNLDVGATLSAFPGVTVGLVARNLIEQKVDTVNTNGSVFTSQHVAPQVVLGAAWSGAGFTLAADIDVTEDERFKLKSTTSPLRTMDPNDESRILRAGGEFDISFFEVTSLQVRAGVQTDLEDTIADVFTAGLGFSLLGVHIDVTGALGEGDTYGAALQTWFTF